LADDDSFQQFQQRQSSYRKLNATHPVLTLERVPEDGGGEKSERERPRKSYRRASSHTRTNAIEANRSDDELRKSDGDSEHSGGGDVGQTDSSPALSPSTRRASNNAEQQVHVPTSGDEQKWARLIPLLPTLPTIPAFTPPSPGHVSPDDRPKDHEEAKLLEFIQAYTQHRNTQQNSLIPVMIAEREADIGASAANMKPNSNNNSDSNDGSSNPSSLATRAHEEWTSGSAILSSSIPRLSKRKSNSFSFSRSNESAVVVVKEEGEVAKAEPATGEVLKRRSKSPRRTAHTNNAEADGKDAKERVRRKSKSPNRGVVNCSNNTDGASNANLLSVDGAERGVEKERENREPPEREKERRNSGNAKPFVHAKRTKSSREGWNKEEGRVEVGHRDKKASEQFDQQHCGREREGKSSRSNLSHSLHALPPLPSNRSPAKDSGKASDDSAIPSPKKIATSSIHNGNSSSSNLSLSSGSPRLDVGALPDNLPPRQQSHERLMHRRCSSPAFTGAMSPRGKANDPNEKVVDGEYSHSHSHAPTPISSHTSSSSSSTSTSSPSTTQRKDHKDGTANPPSFLQTTVSDRTGHRTMPVCRESCCFFFVCLVVFHFHFI
jgi:hypothetical protein